MTALFTPRAVDLFAGGGGASLGIQRATGQAPLVAINHDPAAIAMHAANHRGTLHLCESVFDVRPFRPHNQPLDLLWASPDCRHFSRSKGGKPKSASIRSLAWVVVDWARAVRPSVICVENVEEFRTWGPLDDEGQPIAERQGETFGEWVEALEALGYIVEHRLLVAADFGAPTTRRRLFVVARVDGQPVRWPEPSHGPGRAQPWRTAAECIDWSLPCPSIFGRARPLADKTLARIARGVVRYVLEDANPFVLPVKTWGGGGNEPRSLREPMRTITASKRGEFALAVPSLINTRNGERAGQAPRVRDVRAPMPTATAQGSQGALVAAFLAKHYTGVTGHRVDQPASTVTAVDHHSLVAAHLTKFYGTSTGQALTEPAPTVTAGAGGGHAGLVAAFLTKYYGTGSTGQAVDEPLHTVPTRDRFGLVTVQIAGETYAIVDIGMRMLQPRELARAQGFGDDYILTGTKTEQTARIGNSVPPPVVEAIVRAQFPGWRLRVAA